MSWETINVNEVPVNDTIKQEPFPAGTYTLQLTGAYESKIRPGQTDVSFVVADEGQFRGRKVYVELPDPEQFPWSASVYARIVSKLGAQVTPYASPLDELNKLAGNGHSRLTGDVYIETFTRKDGTTGSKNKVNTRSLRPAA